MNAVEVAIQAKELEKARAKAAMFTGDTIEDAKRDWQKQQDRVKEEQDRVAETVIVSKSEFESAKNYNSLHSSDNTPRFYRSYIEDGHLKFIKPVSFGAYLGERRWFSPWMDIEKAIRDGTPRIHDCSVKPYYFNLKFID